MTETEEIRRKRLAFRSWHRGTRETDLLLGSFADAYLASLAPAELDAFEALLEETDADLWDWITGGGENNPPPDRHAPLLKRLRSFRYRPRSA